MCGREETKNQQQTFEKKKRCSLIRSLRERKRERERENYTSEREREKREERLKRRRRVFKKKLV